MEYSEQIVKYFLRSLTKGDKNRKVAYLENLDPQNLDMFLSISKDDLIELMKKSNYSSQMQDEILSAIEAIREQEKAKNQQPENSSEHEDNAPEDNEQENPQTPDADELEDNAPEDDKQENPQTPDADELKDNAPEDNEQENPQAPDTDELEDNAPKDDEQETPQAPEELTPPLTVNEIEDHDNNPTREADYSNSPEWVQEKCQWYQAQNLPAFRLNLPSEQNPQEFEAEFAGATVHYATPNDVSVSKDAGFKVYDTILKEPQNKDREIEFPLNASTHLSTMLFAASIINGNKITGFDTNKFDINLLNKAVENGEMTTEQLNTVTSAYQQLQPQRVEENENSEQPVENNPERPDTELEENPVAETENRPTNENIEPEVPNGEESKEDKDNEMSTASVCSQKLDQIRSRIKPQAQTDLRSLSGRTQNINRQHKQGRIDVSKLRYIKQRELQ